MSAKALPPRPMLIQLALTWCLRTCLKGAFVGSALLFIISESIGSGLTVERVQRDFQARHKLVTGTYVEWPSCKTGGTPAPHFPKDGFYGDIIEDPEEGVRIVQDLVEKFYVGAIIYNHFVVAPSGYDSIHNAANIAEYTTTDFEDISGADVTVATYLALLSLVSSDTAKLTLMKVQGTATNKEARITHTITTNLSDDSCADVINCITSNHPSTLWGAMDVWG